MSDAEYCWRCCPQPRQTQCPCPCHRPFYGEIDPNPSRGMLLTALPHDVELPGCVWDRIMHRDDK